MTQLLLKAFRQRVCFDAVGTFWHTLIKIIGAAAILSVAASRPRARSPTAAISCRHRFQGSGARSRSAQCKSAKQV